MLNKIRGWFVGNTAVDMTREEGAILLRLTNKLGTMGISLSDEMLQDAMRLSPSPVDLRTRLSTGREGEE